MTDRPLGPAGRQPRPIVLSWSGGKDSALALRALRADPSFQVSALLTTVTAGYDRISMHGVRRTLLEEQAAALGIPLHVVEIEPAAANDTYETRMTATLARLREMGADAVAFGDLYLADVRAYRESMMARVGMSALFPIWGHDTAATARDFIDSGFRAITTCVDTEQIPAGFAGEWYDHDFLARLPAGADPCGENGEFHTFVVDGPGFTRPVTVHAGERVLRDHRFQYCDLLPG
jgi:uncharacterized protein (TIGR00290 family)